jgi:beta-lactamase class A
MIASSDNLATSALHQVLNYKQYLHVFSTLSLPEPDGSDPNYSVTAKDFSAFLKVLYNGTFLSPEMSEKAMKIMLNCDFKKGLVEGLPVGTKIAHKFGEWSDGAGRHELHETGIVYLGSRPYLITVMTSGSDLEKIRNCLPVLAKETHRYLRQMSRQAVSAS